MITGADSGIGRAVAIAFAMEGADIGFVYNVNDEDAEVTRAAVVGKGRRCLVIKADVRHAAECQASVEQTVQELGRLNVLVNNAAYQKANKKFEDVTEEEIRRTFENNIFGYMFMAQAALKHLAGGDTIINTGSIVGLTGVAILIPYTCTKGAIHSFTKSLALNLGSRNINGRRAHRVRSADGQFSGARAGNQFEPTSSSDRSDPDIFHDGRNTCPGA